MNSNRILKNIEWWVLILAIFLCVVGLFALYSTTQSSNYGELKKQIVWIVLGLILMVITTCIDYKVLLKMSPIFYRDINYFACYCIVY